MAGNHRGLWWVGFFDVKAGQGMMTPYSSSTMTHPQILRLFEKVPGRSPYPASWAQAQQTLAMTENAGLNS